MKKNLGKQISGYEKDNIMLYIEYKIRLINQTVWNQAWKSPAVWTMYLFTIQYHTSLLYQQKVNSVVKKPIPSEFMRKYIIPSILYIDLKSNDHFLHSYLAIKTDHFWHFDSSTATRDPLVLPATNCSLANRGKYEYFTLQNALKHLGEDSSTFVLGRKKTIYAKIDWSENETTILKSTWTPESSRIQQAEH